VSIQISPVVGDEGVVEPVKIVSPRSPPVPVRGLVTTAPQAKPVAVDESALRK